MDGIQYRARHDNDEIAVAIFDRAADALRVVSTICITADVNWFGKVLDRYHLGLTD